MKLSAKLRKQVSKALHPIQKETYFNEIPLGLIFDKLKENGIVPLMEDNTEWSGFLCGRNGSMLVHLGLKETEYEDKGLLFYEDVDNAGLALQWYEMRPGRYEVNFYIS